GANGSILTSSDGLDWNNQTPAMATENFIGITNRDGVWYTIEQFGGRIWTSSNTVDWVVTGMSAGGDYFNSLGSAFGALIAPRYYYGGVWFTEDANRWASVELGGYFKNRYDEFNAVAGGNGTAVVVGSNGLIYQAGT